MTDDVLTFEVHGIAQPAGSKTIGKTKDGRSFVRDDNKNAAPWKRQVAQAAGEAMGLRSILEGAVELDILFVQHRPKNHFRANGLLHKWAPPAPIVKPDSTKLTRGVEDALKGIVWRDDSAVVTQLIRKRYGVRAYAVVTVRRFLADVQAPAAFDRVPAEPNLFDRSA